MYAKEVQDVPTGERIEASIYIAKCSSRTLCVSKQTLRVQDFGIVLCSSV